MRKSSASVRKREVMRRLLELASILFDVTKSQQGYSADLVLDDRLVELFPPYKQWLTENPMCKSIPDLPYIFSSESKQEIYACHMLHKLSGELRVIAHWMDLMLDKLQTVGMLLNQAHMYTTMVLDLLSNVDPKNTKRYLRSIASDVEESQILGIFLRAKAAFYRGQHAVNASIDAVAGTETKKLLETYHSNVALSELMNQLHSRLSKDWERKDHIDSLPVLNADPLSVATNRLGISTQHHPHLVEMMTFLSLS